MTTLLFFHPGRANEHIEGRRPWRANSERHERAFLRAVGRARSSSTEEHEKYEGPLTFWGEWEADAIGYALEQGAAGLPTCVLEPAPPSVERNLGALHNTDPFVFGGAFLYSNCQQPWSPMLRSLERGDVIFFGSQLDGSFVLDTVFVVDRRYPFVPAKLSEASLPNLPASFRAATLAPLSYKICDSERTASAETQLSLYIGATPESPVDGMYSFVPALSARPEARAFRRPILCPSSQGQGISTNTGLSWADAVRAVIDAGLLLGTSFSEPTGAR